ncbi:uncharacterized protein LOC111064634 [Nilaparvata lugens]|uniref:uncharacterized protein LOC111064634 n=1 Tax=Nilaparvata lugens TaxID=108931 RepID=UPI00193E11A4|nr:uncharacterized protein LOC111064634 [Nilaparvata lugens]
MSFVISPALSDCESSDTLGFEDIVQTGDETTRMADPVNFHVVMKPVERTASSVCEDYNERQKSNCGDSSESQVSNCEDSNERQVSNREDSNERQVSNREDSNERQVSNHEDSDEYQVEELDNPDSVIFEERFYRLLKGDIASDCKFVVGPQKNIVEGHKLIFSMASEVFYAMFYSQLKEDSIVRIEDVQLDGFLGMKHFIYTGHANFKSVLQASSTYVAARKYLISQLSSECLEYIENIEILPSEVLELYEYCIVNEIPELEEKCRILIQEKTGEVVESDHFLTANAGTILMLLGLESLHLESEQEVFYHLERWATAEAERLDISAEQMYSYFNSLKKHIRFLSMDGEEFTSGPAKSLLLSQEEKLSILFNIMDPNSIPMPDYFDTHCSQKRNFKVPFSNESKESLSSFEKENSFLDQDKFKFLLSGGIVCDCEFIVGPQQNIVKGHKLIFSMASKVFQNQFHKQREEGCKIKINDVELDGFEGMKHYIYTGRINFKTAMQACFTYIASRKFWIPQLGAKCIKYIEDQEIPPSEVLSLYEYCRDREIPDIVEKCIQIIQEETGDVFESQHFSSVHMDTIDKIMSFQKLKLKSEIELFTYFEIWALAEAKRLRLSDKEIATNFNNLKNHIRFLTMKANEFAKATASSLLLTEEEKLNIGLNVINLGSAPYPANLSLSQQERDFSALKTIKSKHINYFKILCSESFPTPYCCYGSCEAYCFSSFDCGFEINVFKCKGNICFRLLPVEFTGQYLFVLKTKLRVIAIDKKYDDLVFETTCSFGFDEELGEFSGGSGRFDIFVAVIPWDKINRSCFIDKKNDEIMIEGSFVLEALDE